MDKHFTLPPRHLAQHGKNCQDEDHKAARDHLPISIVRPCTKRTNATGAAKTANTVLSANPAMKKKQIDE